MGQHQFKLSLSVGTKLLISVVVLLLILVGFLNISAIVLLKEDKQAYTFESKSAEAILAGRNFGTLIQHVVDTLRISLATIDPMQQVTAQQQEALRSVINNQSDLIFASVGLVQPSTGETRILGSSRHSTLATDLIMETTETTVTADWMKVVLTDLSKSGLAFVNLSKPGGSAHMGVLFADLAQKDNAAGMPVAVGVLSLSKIEGELTGLDLTVASRAGWVLFDTDKARLYSRKNIQDDPLFATSLASKVSSGTGDFLLGGRRFLGSFFKPGYDLVVLSRVEWQKAMRATYALTEKFLLLGIMSIGVGIIFAIIFSKTLTAPINRLYKATKEVGQGNFDLNLDVKSNDEIGALTGSFNTMSKKIHELFDLQKEKLQLEQEIAIASTVQQTLIPPQAFDSPDFGVRSFYWPASQCGGDWWGVFRHRSKVVIAIADATGHGLPSALITSSARSFFSMLQKLAEEDPDFSYSPAAMLDFANRVIHDASSGKINMTFFLGVIDLEMKIIRYSNAGHNPPWYYRRTGAGYKLIPLMASGTRLGEGPDAPPFEERTQDIEPEDILFLYTDGLTEGKDGSGTMYGKKRARQVIEKNLKEGPEKVIWSVIDDFSRFAGNKPLEDDVTIAAAVLFGKPAEAPETAHGQA